MKLRRSPLAALQKAANARAGREEDAADLLRLAVKRYREKPTPENHRTIAYYVGLLTTIVDPDGVTQTARYWRPRFTAGGRRGQG